MLLKREPVKKRRFGNLRKLLSERYKQKQASVKTFSQKRETEKEKRK